MWWKEKHQDIVDIALPHDFVGRVAPVAIKDDQSPVIWVVWSCTRKEDLPHPLMASIVISPALFSGGELPSLKWLQIARKPLRLD